MFIQLLLPMDMPMISHKKVIARYKKAKAKCKEWVQVEIKLNLKALTSNAEELSGKINCKSIIYRAWNWIKRKFKNLINKV